MLEARTGIDGWPGRAGALAVILVCVAALAFIHRDWFLAPEEAAETILNPEHAACLEKRLAAVDAMKADAIIGDAQYERFRDRAIAYCDATFGGEPSSQS